MLKKTGKTSKNRKYASAAASASHLARRTPGTKWNRKAGSEKEADRIYAHLLRAISHDLRTPLSSIMGNSLIYLDNHESLEESEKLRLVTHIYEDSSWLVNMAENLLAIARIGEWDRTVSTREEIVEEVLSEALQKMERRHPSCEIHVAIPDDIILLPMDATLIEQVMVNLLENALLHSDSQKPIDIIVEDSPRKVSFTIRDYGKGIPEDLLESTFCKISSTPNPHTKTCIGLTICKAIISAHHGTLTGRNHSHGAEFIFTLPKRRCNTPQ